MSVATFVIHIDNMSYRVSENDVVEFLAINPENILNIKMVKNDRGQANGDCYVEISNQSDAEAALKKHLTQFAGRKAQISKSSPEEMNNSRAPVKVKGGKGGKWDGTVRLYGFSYESTIDTVMEFCQGLDVLPGRVVIEKDVSGRSSGNAYVQFATFTGAYGALDRNKKQLDSIGRYIDSEASSNVDYRICVFNNKKLELAAKQGQAMGSIPNGGLNLQGVGGLNFSNTQWNTAVSQNAGGPMRNNFAANNVRSAPYGMPGSQANNSFGSPPSGAPVAFAGANPTSFANPAAAPANPVQATIAAAGGNSGCPFPHVIHGTGFPDGVSNKDIQEYFKPYRAIAVKMEDDGSGDVAFKTHSDCVGAMGKQGNLLLGCMIRLELRSEDPNAGIIKRGGGWTTQ